MRDSELEQPQAAVGQWYRSPLVLTVGALVLIGAGVAAGVLLAGRSTPPAVHPGIATPPGMGAQGPAVAVAPGGSPKLAEMRKAAEPENATTKAILAYAHQALDEEQLPEAIAAYRRVLTREPKNPEALTHWGQILLRAEHVDQALAKMDEALAVDPNYAHAHWDRAHLLFDVKKDYAAAIPSFEAFLRQISTGPEADQARRLLEEARRLARTSPRPATQPQGQSPAPPGPRSDAPSTGTVVPVAARQPLSPAAFEGEATRACQVAPDHGQILAQLHGYRGRDVSAGRQSPRDRFMDRQGTT